MQLILRRIAAAAFLAAAALPLFAVDMRAQVGEPRATQLQSVLTAAIPGSEVTWEDRVTVKLADGAKSEVHLAGLIEVPRAGGPLVLMQIELLDFQSEAVQHVKTFAGTPPPHPADITAVLQTNTAGAITAQKIGRLDPDAVFIETKQFELDTETTDDPWPAVKATYWATYATTDWYGAVRWYAVVESETLGNNSRMPLGVSKTTRAGDETADQVAATRVSDAIVQIEGGLTGQIVAYPCLAPCLFDGKTLLAAWGMVPPAVAAEE
ncbi:MAG TPA: hypothetical protein VF432_11100 [Thermoanaerobaculia bacterium]